MTLQARIDRTLGRFRLDIDLTTKSGETVAVLGPNGSGKSTLFRCLAGLLPIDEGRIELDRRGPRRTGHRHLRGPRAATGRRRVPGLPAVPQPDRAGERRLRAARPRRPQDRGPHRRRGLAGPGRARRPRRPPPASPVRRAGPARRARPGPGHPATAVAARRTAGRPRRRHPRRRAPRPPPSPGHLRRSPAARHPRPRRRLCPRRPGDHPRSRPGGADRNARRRHRPAPLPLHRRPRRREPARRHGQRRRDHHPDRWAHRAGRHRYGATPSRSSNPTPSPSIRRLPRAARATCGR